eukprot:1093796-Rhodomonas_salina.1
MCPRILAIPLSLTAYCPSPLSVLRMCIVIQGLREERRGGERERKRRKRSGLGLGEDGKDGGRKDMRARFG